MRKRTEKSAFSLTFTCKQCGEPISKTSVDFGMDCKNDCARRAFEAGDTRLTIQAKAEKEKKP